MTPGLPLSNHATRSGIALRDTPVFVCEHLYYTDGVTSELLDLDLLDDEWPFEIDDQVGHLFKHPYLGADDIAEVWRSDPLFYPARPPAHWLMVAEVSGRVLVVPLTPARSGGVTRCRPIGCYVAADHLAQRYREDR